MSEKESEKEQNAPLFPHTSSGAPFEYNNNNQKKKAQRNKQTKSENKQANHQISKNNNRQIKKSQKSQKIKIFPRKEAVKKQRNKDTK